VQQNVPSAIFAYNHADWYVQEVLSWASTYASGGFTVDNVTPAGGSAAVSTGASTQCATQNAQLAAFAAPNALVATAVSYAEDQLGKPYLFGGTGPAAFDCSGLVMMAYRAAGVDLPRTTYQQVYAGSAVYSLSQLQPGDLLFTPGSDGTAANPGHVGMYIGTYHGEGLVVQAPQTGEDIQVTPLAGYWQQSTVAIRRVA
jgi:cell wall-associated NlpC family hydrolase